MGLKRLLKAPGVARARRYLHDNGVMDLLKDGDAAEIAVKPFDLYNIHRLVRTRKPETVLEFGVGFSTIVIAHALKMNGGGTVWSVDTNAHWIGNLEQKIPADLRPFVRIKQSDVEVAMMNGELCHFYRELPSITPDFVYLDGPDPYDVKGSVRGLSFTHEDGGYRHPMSADMLLLESALKSGFMLLIDARYANMHFLRRNLKRRYRFRWNRLFRVSTFELREHTDRNSFYRTATPTPTPARSAAGLHS